MASGQKRSPRTKGYDGGPEGALQKALATHVTETNVIKYGNLLKDSKVDSKLLLTHKGLLRDLQKVSWTSNRTRGGRTRRKTRNPTPQPNRRPTTSRPPPDRLPTAARPPPFRPGTLPKDWNAGPPPLLPPPLAPYITPPPLLPHPPPFLFLIF